MRYTHTHNIHRLRKFDLSLTQALSKGIVLAIFLKKKAGKRTQTGIARKAAARREKKEAKDDTAGAARDTTRQKEVPGGNAMEARK